MYAYHTAPWSPHYDDRDRTTHTTRTKQREKEEQRLGGDIRWSRTLDTAGEYRRPKEELEAAKVERRYNEDKYRRIEEQRRYEGTLPARKPERQPQYFFGGGGTRGDWLSQVEDLSQLLCLLWGAGYWAGTVFCGRAHDVSSALF